MSEQCDPETWCMDCQRSTSGRCARHPYVVAPVTEHATQAALDETRRYGVPGILWW